LLQKDRVVRQSFSGPAQDCIADDDVILASMQKRYQSSSRSRKGDEACVKAGDSQYENWKHPPRHNRKGVIIGHMQSH